MENRPQGREKRVSGQGKSIYRRGSGMGTGPVGNPGTYNGNQTFGAGQGTGPSRNVTRAGGRSPIVTIIIVAALLLFGGGGGLSALLGGGGQETSYPQQQPSSSYQQSYTAPQQSTQQVQTPDLSTLLGGYSSGSVSYGWGDTQNTAQLNTEVSSAARDKFTTIYGDGSDKVTIMVYMCGTDLESRSGMASSDLMEMANAGIGDNINLLVYTGGCKSWRLNISNEKNQIYKLESVQGQTVKRLVAEAGSSPMTSPDTLSAFIKWCAKNYPANRNEIIFWDHGGGSLSGYGYDEKYASSGSMTLNGIEKALKDGGVKFDFIGFDACLMATLENAMMLSDYGDYLIASEETEPGVGWYYTNWLKKLSDDPSMPTVNIGKNIVDDFVSVCAQKCRGQQTTLSVVDLAELEATVPDALKDFATATSKQVSTKFETVSKARSGAREFATSSKIDQIDLVDFANRLGTKEAKELSDTLLSAVKYNRTSSTMTNAYGLSIYFPYQRTSKVDSAVAQYEAIGMDSEYARVIQQFASMEVSGQAVSGGAASPLSMLSGTGMSSGTVSSDMITQMLSSLMGGNLYGVSGLTGSNSSFIGKSLDPDAAAECLNYSLFDPNQLVWSYKNGKPVLQMDEHQWSLVNDLELNVFYFDGEGYIDLGLDNVFDFDDEGALSGEFDGTWLAINEQPVPYYHINTSYDGDNYTITGRVPVLLNGERADLILVFDNEEPYGYVAGATYDYRDGQTETIAKNLTELQIGDTLDFICDYYGTDGSYRDSYLMGDPMIVDGEFYISNVYIDASFARASYRITDIYNQQYWTPVMACFN